MTGRTHSACGQIPVALLSDSMMITTISSSIEASCHEQSGQLQRIKSEDTEVILPQNIRDKRIIAYLCKHFGREGEGLCLSKVRMKPVFQKRETNSTIPERISRDIPL